MKRRALIISSFTDPLATNFNAGVIKDGRNFVRFLISSNGGAWKPKEEVVALQNPSVRELAHWLSFLDGADMAQVYYSGHGFRDRASGLDYIHINGQQVFRVNALFRNASRQIITTDTCRSYSSFSNFSEGLGDVSTAELDFTDQVFARNMYAELVKKAPYGKLLINSSSPGEKSYCDNEGGDFTLSLLKAARNFQLRGDRLLLTAWDFCNRAEVMMHANFGARQIPTMYHSNNADLIKIPMVIHPQAGRQYLASRRQVRY
jgi:hypothetical protein